MPITKIYSERAIIFDANEYPDGWDNRATQQDFIAAANEHCHNFLPPDWYINTTAEDYLTKDNIVITVGLKRYEDGMNLQPLWNFQLIADPYEENVTGDRQWIVFDVVRWEPNITYSFQLP